MPFQLIRQDITKIEVDAIVNPTDRYFSHKGGTDKQIHDAAGPKLYKACIEQKPLDVGECIITKAYDLKNTKYVIHTYGPIYNDGKHDEEKKLYSCYKNALELANSKKLESIAFPLISSGTFSFPKGEALSIATKAITDYLVNNELNIFLLVFDKSAFDTSKKIFKIVDDYLKKDGISNYESSNSYLRNELIHDRRNKFTPINRPIREDTTKSLFETKFKKSEPYYEYLQKLIKEKDLKDSDIYKKANIDRRLWNKIINGEKKGMEKTTAVAIAIGMKLNVDETKDLCERIGYSFTDTNTFDKVIRVCIESNIYSINDINWVLNYNDLPQLGSSSK